MPRISEWLQSLCSRPAVLSTPWTWVLAIMPPLAFHPRPSPQPRPAGRPSMHRYREAAGSLLKCRFWGPAIGSGSLGVRMGIGVFHQLPQSEGAPLCKVIASCCRVGHRLGPGTLLILQRQDLIFTLRLCFFLPPGLVATLFLSRENEVGVEPEGQGEA